MYKADIRVTKVLFNPGNCKRYRHLKEDFNLNSGKIGLCSCRNTRNNYNYMQVFLMRSIGSQCGLNPYYDDQIK